jgi:hypothetical protein
VQTVFNLIASLLKQLVQDHSAAYDRVKSLYEYHHDRRTRPTLNGIQQALQSEIGTFTKVFIIVDALDECSETDGTRATLVAALRSLATTVKLLVTSRDLASISRDFHEAKRLEIHATNHDVRTYIERRISQVPRLAIHVDGNSMMRKEIVKKVTANARGMYVSQTPPPI